MIQCICKGNLRQLVDETSHVLDKVFVDKKGNRYRFFGIVIGSDDYYYGMSEIPTGKTHLLSCVGNLETWEFKLENINE